MIDDRICRFDWQPIEVIVGKAERKFYVHETLICSKSEFFAKALNKVWIEKQQRRVVMPEDDPELFLGYLNWVYTGTIPCL